MQVIRYNKVTNNYMMKNLIITMKKKIYTRKRSKKNTSGKKDIHAKEIQTKERYTNKKV